MNRIKSIVQRFDWRVVAAMVALAFLLGVLNNLRVEDEQKVQWFGGPVVSAEMDEGEDV